MRKAKIALIDNDLDFLNTRRELLERAGYEVIIAATLPEARKALSRSDIDVAILDIRIEDDDDEKDITGLLLAAEESFLAIPKIIMTGYPTQEQVHQVMSTNDGKLPIALDFIAKQEGVEAMITAITRALAVAMMVRARTVEHRGATALNREVFIVHGHDEAAKLAVEKLIRNLGLEPILLSELPSAGRTIIEQIEECSGVSFAVVILSPDDIGYLKTDPKRRIPRARQNVIFELGYFMGRLGRERVRSLHLEGVEILSDYEGVIYIPMDSSGAWKIRLAKELRSAGFKVDLNKGL